jgi:tRNA/rRNA methyltransferase
VTLSVVLVAPRNPLNIGAAARAISNFGFTDLRLVNPYKVAFREARSAIGAGAVLRSAHEFTSVAEAVADCSLIVGTTAVGHRVLEHPLRRLEYGARLIRRARRVALLFGSEKFGLSNDDLSHCHWLLRIPTRPQHGAMNLGQAVAVVLYEIVRDAKAARAQPEPKKRAAAVDEERVTDVLIHVLSRSGYVHDESTPAKVRRLVRRLGLNQHDAQVMLGMLRQILWRIEH